MTLSDIIVESASHKTRKVEAELSIAIKKIMDDNNMYFDDDKISLMALSVLLVTQTIIVAEDWE